MDHLEYIILQNSDRLDGVSNFAIWKSRILTVLEEYGIRDHAENILAVSTDVDALKKFNENQAQAKHLIMDGVKDNVFPYTVERRRRQTRCGRH